jgi:hypothetical protein
VEAELRSLKDLPDDQLASCRRLLLRVHGLEN